MTQFVVAWTGLETSLGAIARITLFEGERPAEEDSGSLESGVPLEAEAVRGPGSGALRFENVWGTYDAKAGWTGGLDRDSSHLGREWSLRGVSLDVKPGERIAVCGKTGSGKSTMHLALLRMVNMPIGSIFIDGIDHSNISLEALRKGFYAISQDSLEGFDHLRQQLNPIEAGSDETSTRRTEEKMEMLIRARLNGRTLIAINHRLEAVMEYDRVVVLHNGMVADVGTPAEPAQHVLASRRFAALTSRFDVGDGRDSDSNDYDRVKLVRLTYEYARSEESRNNFLRASFEIASLPMDTEEDNLDGDTEHLHDALIDFADYLFDNFFLPSMGLSSACFTIHC
ncbi:ATP-binding cassette transporter [Grosmannia clavigera kw1407]|uniref:ATP-binding cassette transporter n=1 Tax=Grosmannia clavigera (strain kw1407 / UAMH 11150) TaxID=655863 RepID=F0XKG2_GROCL|nr:ATP-binding cassette transporter [Grosmannia clavigera kw1407]EFX01765.1 ATP-binding cassette transporter [Grosmannia clavigera kw1407]